jgi:hypothetical protein
MKGRQGMVTPMHSGAPSPVARVFLFASSI